MKKEELIKPKHISIIMDGNRRWARERNLPELEGHAKGYGVMGLMPEWFFAQGVELVSVFAFSINNWSLPREEVNDLMKLIQKALTDNLDSFVKKGYKIIISGRIEELPGDLPEVCAEAILQTKDGRRGTLNICLNYGGRAEIVDAIRKMIKNKIDIEQVHEGLVKKYLYHGDLSDPDMIIRTADERSLSGFQMWQAERSELFFISKYWPDFEKLDAEKLLSEYAERKKAPEYVA